MNKEQKIDYKHISRIQLMNQSTRKDIINTILVHPLNLPSLVEISKNSEYHKSTIHEHLEKLESEGIVKKHKNKSDVTSRNSPRVFYSLTSIGYNTVAKSSSFDSIEKLREETEKRFEEYESIERPEIEIPYINGEN